MARIRSLLAAVAALAFFVSAGCAAGPAASDTSSDGSFVVAVAESIVQDLTPGASQASFVDYALFSPLTRVDPATGTVQNLVASSLETTDQVHWTIEIAPGWTFHDGSPVTAQSFADSWNTTATAANALSGNARMSIFEGYPAMNPEQGEPTATELSGVEVTGERTLSITLSAPNSLLPYILSASRFAPIPASAADDLKAFATHPIGNGPFRVRDGGWALGDQDVFLDRYDGYAGTKAAAASVNLRVYQASSNPYTDFEAGQLDVALIDGDDLVRAKESTPEAVVDVNLPAVVYLGFPLYDKRFSDVRVRKAIALAVDRETIVSSLLSGTAEPAKGIGPSLLAGADRVTCESCAYDPAEAKRLLADAGGWSGPLKLMTYQEPTNERVLEAIANQLRDNLGITDVSFEAQEIGQLYDGLRAKKSQSPNLLYSGAPYPHVYAMANQLLTAGAPLNVTGYDDEEFAAIMERAASAGTPEEATALAVQAADRGLAAVPLTPLYYPKAGLVHSDRVGSVSAEILGGAYLAGVTVNGS
ncbi:ABC transporter substrate-binding protein [Microlunatus sp. GCM10028923]|uniref:ABC transporter substrate-binding protein n=1 Tax=Microlunatus sp. GCM10028923 TaxID=3273400 RepID=UPI003616F132